MLGNALHREEIVSECSVNFTISAPIQQVDNETCWDLVDPTAIHLDLQFLWGCPFHRPHVPLCLIYLFWCGMAGQQRPGVEGENGRLMLVSVLNGQVCPGPGADEWKQEKRNLESWQQWGLLALCFKVPSDTLHYWGCSLPYSSRFPIGLCNVATRIG